MTMHEVARMKGITMPVARSKVARPRWFLPQPLARMEYGSMKVMLMPTAAEAAATSTVRCLASTSPDQNARAASLSMVPSTSW